jgi:hypothetical protein
VVLVGDNPSAVLLAQAEGHHDVVGVIGEDTVHLAAVHGLGPAFGQVPDLCRVIGRGSSHSLRS